MNTQRRQLLQFTCGLVLLAWVIQRPIRAAGQTKARKVELVWTLGLSGRSTPFSLRSPQVSMPLRLLRRPTRRIPTATFTFGLDRVVL